MSETIRSILDQFVDRDASILDLGCGCGRHLAHLYEHGFENLAGIDVNNDAFDVMEETYPSLAADGTFYIDAIENTVDDFDDNHFDVVYSVETLQHLHPDSEWVLEELARITDDLLVTIENEGENDRSQSDEFEVTYINDDFPLYYRNWNRVFTEVGLVEVDARPGKRGTVRTFRSPQE